MIANITKELRINEAIRAKEIRLVGNKGEQLGIMAPAKALDIARREGLDLVEVAPNVSPPVCRVMDYGKYRYEQARKARESKKNQRTSLVREVRLRPKIEEHDLAAKARVARKLLEDGNKLKVTVLLRGRENIHPELGVQLLNRFAEVLSDIAIAEQMPVKENSRLHVVLSSTGRKKTAKEGDNAKTQNA